MLLRIAKWWRKSLSFFRKLFHWLGLCSARVAEQERERKKMSSGGSEIDGRFVNFSNTRMVDFRIPIIGTAICLTLLLILELVELAR